MLIAFTDGSSLGNPGRAASAHVLVRDGVLLEARARPLGQGTNNLAEVIAARDALFRAVELADAGEPVVLVADSTYVLDGLPVAGVRARPGYPNNEAWAGVAEALDALASAGHALYSRWVAGHSGTPCNELCDRLARAAASDQVAKRAVAKEDHEHARSTV